MRSPIIVAAVIALAAITTDCSLLNRNGPDVTCADLGNGSANACASGIIAACLGGQVSYQVCDDSGACEQSWQQMGAFACTQGGPPFMGNPGTGGGGTGASGSGAGTGTGAGGTGGTATCSPSAVCPIADSGGTSIVAFAADGVDVYFTDDKSAWSVPRTGGFAKGLGVVPTDGQGAPGFTSDDMPIDSTSIYLLFTNQNTIARMPKIGGSFGTVVSFPGGAPFHVVADDTRFYWFAGYQIVAQAKSGGAPVVLVNSTEGSAGGIELSLGGGFIYWGGTGVINRVPTSATGPTAPTSADVSMGMTNASVLAVAADASGIYYAVHFNCGGCSPSVWALPTGSNTPVHLGDGIGNQGHLGLSATSVFWTGTGVVMKAPKNGSAPAAAIYTANDPTLNNTRFAADDAYVYWRASTKIFRAPK